MRRTWFVAAIVGCATSAGCHETAGASKGVHPAEVTGERSEAELTTVRLTPRARERLGVETRPCRREVLRRTRAYVGVLEVPAGRTATVTAPVDGLLLPPTSGSLPAMGHEVERGHEVLRLVPLGLRPDQDLVTLEREALARQQLAESRYARAASLLEDGGASRRQVEDARAELEIATAETLAIESRQKLLRLATEGEGDVAAWGLTAPFTGRLDRLRAAPGQVVGSATPLFDIADDRELWLRVPVLAGELEELDRGAVVEVRALGGTSVTSATPVPIPPSSNDAALELWFSLPNPDGRWRPGQRVAATLRLTDPTPDEGVLTVPASAILYDSHGGTWVYVAEESDRFVRRRVEVDRIEDGVARLGRGPRAGEAVVTVGAAELFGTEFGVGH